MKAFHDTEIENRFFKAVDTVIEMGLIRGVNTFTSEHNIDRRNFMAAKKAQRGIRLSWIYFLVTDFNISSEWIITGNGSMFKK